MEEALPPWERPAAACAGGGREENHGAFGKPLETMGRKARRCRVRGSGRYARPVAQANQRKRWDRKARG